MVPSELLKEYKIQKIWTCSKKDERFVIGYISAFLVQCEDGRWLAITPDTPSGKSEILILKTRVTAMNRLRERGFWTRVSKIYPSAVFLPLGLLFS